MERVQCLSLVQAIVIHSFIHSSKIIIQYLFITDYLVIIENKNSTFDLIGEVRVYMEEEEEGVIKDVPPWINKSKLPFCFTEHISLGCGGKQRFSRGFSWGTNIGDYTGQEVKRVDWPVNIPARSKESSRCPNVSTHSLLNPKKLRAQNGSEPIKRCELLAAGKAAPRPCFSLNLAMLKHLSFCPQNIHFILN